MHNRFGIDTAYEHKTAVKNLIFNKNLYCKGKFI